MTPFYSAWLETQQIADFFRFPTGNMCIVTEGANLRRIDMNTLGDRQALLMWLTWRTMMATALPLSLNILLLAKNKKTNKKIWISLLRKWVCFTIAEERNRGYLSDSVKFYLGDMLEEYLYSCYTPFKVLFQKKDWTALWIKNIYFLIYKLVWDGEMECIQTEYVLYWSRDDWGILAFLTDLHACC